MLINFTKILIKSTHSLRAMQETTSENQPVVIINLPKDLGDCLLCVPAIQRVINANAGAQVVATGSKLAAGWIEGLGGLTLDLRPAEELDPRMNVTSIFNFNFYQPSVAADVFPLVPFYAPEKLVTVKEDGPDFGAGAVIGKKHVGALLTDCLVTAGLLEPWQRLPLPAVPGALVEAGQVADTKTKFGLPEFYALLIPVCAQDRPFKKWQTEKFVELAKRIQAAGTTPVLVGGPSPAEKELCAEIAAKTGGAIMNICGETAIPEIASLAAGAAFTVGNDTGPTHIAAVTGSPTFAFFGYYNDPNTWRPMNAANTACVISADRIQNISIDDVWKKVEPLANPSISVRRRPTVLRKDQ